MNGEVLLWISLCDKEGNSYKGEANSIDDLTTENIIKEIQSYYSDNPDVKLEVTQNDIDDWLTHAENRIDQYDFDDHKYLHVATVKRNRQDHGYDEFELEYYIEDE